MYRLGYRRYNEEVIKKAKKYRREGLSLKEISKLLRIPHGTIGNWVRSIELTENQKKRLKEKEKTRQTDFGLSSINVHNTAIKKHKKWYQEGKEIKLDENNLIGLIVYACEGSHSIKSQEVSAVNSKPIFLLKFMNTVESVFNIDRTRWKLRINIHPYHNREEVIDYWSKEMRINKDRICTHVYGNGGRRLRKDYMGCASITICGVQLRCKLEGLIDRYIERNYSIGSGSERL